MTASTNSFFFGQVMEDPLFFMERKIERYVKQTSNGAEEEEHCVYTSARTEISAYLSDEKTIENISHLDYVLLIVENEIVDNQDVLSESVNFSYRIASPQCGDDWIFILNSLIKRSQNQWDKFPFKYLLWFLNHANWTNEQLEKAICQYNIKVRPYILNWLQRICRCLSFQKQKQVKEVAHSFDFEYEIYMPSQITDALKYVTPRISGANCNLFDLIDYILGDYSEEFYLENENLDCHNVDLNSTNDIIRLYKWFNCDNPLEDYRLLKSIYSLVSDERQHAIIQRYFYDISTGRLDFDKHLVAQFRDNDFSEFMLYRYCINTPGGEVHIGNQLLCDCILTLYETHGKSLQSFNGIMDFVMKRCDEADPKINLGLAKFLPRCDGGAVYNDAFSGFVDYSILVSLDEGKFTSVSLEKAIVYLLDSIGRKKRYFACKYDENRIPLDETSKCLTRLRGLNVEKCNCAILNSYEDKWIVKSENSDWLDMFVDNMSERKKGSELEIDIRDTSIERMKESIYNIASKYEIGDSGICQIESKEKDSLACKLLFAFSIPKAMRIWPRKQVRIGSRYDLLEVGSLLPKDLDNEEFTKEFRNKEAVATRERVVSTLKAMLDEGVYNGEYFESAYDKSLLEEVRRLYYCRKSINVGTKDSEQFFLKTIVNKEVSLFCAPKLSKNHNQATDLPFCWCRGRECFHNVLDKQCLKNCSSWRQYTLFHMAEIIGFPKLRQVESCFEPDGIISLFIVVANKAMKKFMRLKCRACGHLMYPVKRDVFDRSNYYACINPTCPEYGKDVYLNYCYKCKRGLIDSRDTKQCPNGWFICPTCLSCCDDDQYERLAQRYVISHLPIPYRIQSKLGGGHNNKGFYFCPKCGSELDVASDGANRISAYCKSCGKSLP